MQVDPDPADRPLTPNPAHALKSEYFGSLGVGGEWGGLNPLCPLVLHGQISYMKFVECGVFFCKNVEQLFFCRTLFCPAERLKQCLSELGGDMSDVCGGSGGERESAAG